MLKSKKGITLVALVVTIVILIILAGVALTIVLGNGGILQRTRDAKAIYINSSAEEKQKLSNLEQNMDSYLEEESNYPTLNKIALQASGLSNCIQFVRASKTMYDAAVAVGTTMINIGGDNISPADDTVKGWIDTANGSYIYYCYSSASIIFLPTDSSNMFKDCSSLESIDMTGFDSSNVTNMANMFNTMDMDYNQSLTSITLPSTFDTSKVTNMSSMFENYLGTSLDISMLNTSSVTNMSRMFECRQLTSLTFPSTFDTSKVTDMGQMFLECSKLTSLTLPDSFNTLNVTDMHCMFQDCNLLNTINYGTYFVNTSCTKFYSMLENCQYKNTTTPFGWTNGTWIKDGTFIKS